MSAGGRRGVSIALAVLGSVLALAGGFAFYVRSEVFDSDAFADNAAESLKDEQVRAALADPITDQAVDRGPDALINVRPVLLAAVEGVLDSPPFRAVFRKGARKAYEAIFAKDKEKVALSLNNADVLVAGALSQLSPKASERVPKNVGDRLLTITQNDLVLKVARISEEVRFLGIVLPLLAILCLVGSVAVAVDRRVAVLQVSAGLAMAATAGFILLLIARGVVVSGFTDDTQHDAVGAVYDAFLGGLSRWSLGLGLLAIVAAAGVATAGEKDASAPARRVWAWATKTPEGTWGRVGRAVGVGLLGLYAVLNPDEALDIVMVVAGAYALYFAACELFGLLAPPEGTKRTSQISRQRVAAAAAASLVAVVVGAIWLTSGGDEGKREIARPPGPVEACNGFAELCERPLNEVAFPSAHNAMSAAELPNWFQPNQRFDIRAQLDDGVRGFLIDAHYGINRPSGPVLTDLNREGESKVLETIESQLGPDAVSAFQGISAQYANRGGEGKQGTYLCHVVCELGSIELVRALGWFRDFLLTHPDEVLVLFVEDYVTPVDIQTAFEKSDILPYAHVQKPGRPFPTMRELIESDKRLFVMAEKDSGTSAIPWYHDGFSLAMETPYTFGSPVELAAKASCVPNRGGEGKPLFQLNNWVEKVPRSPTTAKLVNSLEFLVARARRCERRRQALPNLVAVDFYDKGDVVAASQELNGIAADAEPSYRSTD
jgi:hypothetical protein